MRIVHDIDALRAACDAAQPLAFVPTMGNLHAGHLALVREAGRHAPQVAVSIFVNRLQFAPHEDFDRYPRTFVEDCAQLSAAGVGIVFAPDESVLYPAPQTYRVSTPAIGEQLEGHFRPGFFQGVATVVLKLLNCVQPACAVFGKKDYQQLMIVRGMVCEFNLPLSIIACDTVREADGLAMSSRNRYLSATERAEAPRLYETLRDVAARACAGEPDFGALAARAMDRLSASGWQPDYVDIRRRHDLQPPLAGDSALVALAAARLGTTRLIDNLEFDL